MKIQLKKLSLLNFKGIKSLEIDFSEVTDIAGKNATGKSTVFDAFTWLLFGKNAQDQKTFAVKTYNEKGVVIPKLDHSVEGLLIIDGVETKLTRTLKEMWVKKRGSETAEMTGNETVFFVNDVPKKEGEYQLFINSIIPEATFKLLTSPTYFNALKWNDRREMLTSITGTPTDEEIAGNDLVNLLTTMRNEKKTIEDLKKEYIAKKNNLKKAIGEIPSRIDEVTRNTPQAQDWKQIEGEIKTGELELTVIDQELADKSKGIEDAIRTRSEMLINKSNLEQKLSSLEFQARQEFATAGSKKDSEISAKKQKIESLQQSILNYNNDAQSLSNRIINLNAQNEELRNKWTVKNAEKLERGNELTCPTCGQSLPDDLVEHKMAEAEKNFNGAKVAELKSIQTLGSSNKAQIEELTQSIGLIRDKIDFSQKEIKELEAQIKVLESHPVHSQSIEAILTKNEEYAITKQRVSEILVPETIPQPDTAALKQRRYEVSQHINELTSVLAAKELIATMDKRKDDLGKEEKQLAQQIASLEKIEYQIDQFTKRKISEVERRVNEMFPSVSFRMFNQTIEGNDVPACDCRINGVPYSDANSAGKTLAGLEIISVFSKAHDKYCPVFIDNSEGINFIPSMPNQVVTLTVTKDAKLTITA
ncbi:MAG: ATP-binding protein [Bacteroidota bacterium]